MIFRSLPEGDSRKMPKNGIGFILIEDFPEGMVRRSSSEQTVTGIPAGKGRRPKWFRHWWFLTWGDFEGDLYIDSMTFYDIKSDL